MSFSSLEVRIKKVGSQEIPGVTVRFGCGVQNEAEQKLTDFHQENMRQQKRHRCIEQSFGLCGRGRGWDDLREQH